MKTKTIALTAAAALAVPVAAQAAKPAEPGKKGKDRAAQTKAAKPAKKAKGVGFTVKGTTAETALPVADGALTGPLTLDPAGANKHARTLLGLSTDDVAGTTTGTFGEPGDEVVVRYVGLSEGDALTGTDVVKVVGKVARTGKGKAKALGALDIRRIVVTREAPEEQVDEEPQS